ncbi:MAG: Uma2 family endonuclease [Acidobacteria bacterium]|nr:MAG: Uma2 family endonuclease [Acidobacteriota bacterium]
MERSITPEVGKSAISRIIYRRLCRRWTAYQELTPAHTLHWFPFRKTNAILFFIRGPMETEVTKKLFTVDEYHRMAEAGIFHPEARLELIEGEIIEMSPPGIRHIACVNRANAVFTSRLAGKAMVSVQNPLILSRYTEPQPDIVLAKPRADFYAEKWLSSEDTFLAIEVSDSTISYDRNRKMSLYARARVRELWIENLREGVILVFRDPRGNGYKTCLTFQRGQSFSPSAFPEVTFTVEELLG